MSYIKLSYKINSKTAALIYFEGIGNKKYTNLSFVWHWIHLIYNALQI